MSDENLENLRMLFQDRFPLNVIQTVYIEMNKNFETTMDRLINFETYYGHIPPKPTKIVNNIEMRESELSAIFIIVNGYVRIKCIGINNEITSPIDIIEIIIKFYALSVQKERKIMKQIGYQMQREGDIWYPISKSWWDIWTKYTCWVRSDSDIPGGIDNMHKLKCIRPGTIDNSELQDENDSSALKLVIQENLTHIWIHEKVWKKLHEWYGGGPIFPRRVYSKYGKKLYTPEGTYICVYPMKFTITYVDPETGAINDNCVTTIERFPKDCQLLDIAKYFEDNMEWNSNEEKEDTPFVHLWLPFKYIKQIYPVDKKVTVNLDDLKNEDPNRWVEMPDDYLKLTISDLIMNSDETIIDNIAVEYCQYNNNDDLKLNNESKKYKWPKALNNNEWKNFKIGQIIDVRDPQQSKWYECVIRNVIKSNNDDNNSELIIHYIGWAIKWDEKIKSNDIDRIQNRHTYTKGPHRPQRNRRRYVRYPG